jgi:hypothetical protein
VAHRPGPYDRDLLDIIFCHKWILLPFPILSYGGAAAVNVHDLTGNVIGFG